MNQFPRWLRIVGLVVHVLIGALLIFAGSAKAFGFAPQETVDQMVGYGLGGQLKLIGGGEMIAALLLITPRTMSLGTLVTSGFWGGVICTHMAHGEPYAIPAVLLAVTWFAASLRDPRMFASFSPAK